MRVGGGFVGKLPHNEGVAYFFLQAFGLFHGAGKPLGFRSQHDVRAVRPDVGYSLRIDVFGHNDFAIEPHRRRTHCHAYGEIPCRSFDYDGIFGYPPIVQSVPQNLSRRPVLYASRRIKPLHFPVNGTASSRQVTDFDQRSSADGFQNVVVNHNYL